MKFNIRFTIGELPGTLIDDFNPGIGLDVVNEVRELINRPELKPLQVIVGDVCEARNGALRYNNIQNEKIIISAPQFKTRHSINVIVRPGFFGRFMVINTNVIYVDSFKNKLRAFAGNQKEINRVEITYKVDWDSVLKQWSNDGFPSYWGFTKDEYEKKIAPLSPPQKRKKINQLLKSDNSGLL